MKILLDLTHIKDKTYTGIGNVAFDIVKGLHTFSDYDIELLIYEGQESWYDNCLGFYLPKISISAQEKSIIEKKWLKFCPPYLLKEIKNNSYDIILVPRLSLQSIIFPKTIRQIGVIHDLQHLRMRAQEKKWISLVFNSLLTIIRYNLVTKLVAISNYTKHDIRKYTLRNSVVIYNSVRIGTSESSIKDLFFNKYILDVNSFWKYKNTERLIDAFSLISSKVPHILYLKGNADKLRLNELTIYVERKGLKGKVIIDCKNRSEDEMNYLYNHASLFVSPSLMEGFGLTPIEAALHRVPVIVSNIETFEEITDGRVDLFDPYSVDELAKLMLKIIENPPRGNVLEDIAHYYENKYSQKKQAEGFIELIKKIQ